MMNRALPLLTLFCLILGIANGCGPSAPPIQTDLDAAQKAEIEAHNKAVDDAERAQSQKK